jgi:hypothetical protein
MHTEMLPQLDRLEELGNVRERFYFFSFTVEEQGRTKQTLENVYAGRPDLWNKIYAKKAFTLNTSSGSIQLLERLSYAGCS